jgi:hypothetical protein
VIQICIDIPRSSASLARVEVGGTARTRLSGRTILIKCRSHGAWSISSACDLAVIGKSDHLQG